MLTRLHARLAIGVCSIVLVAAGCASGQQATDPATSGADPTTSPRPTVHASPAPSASDPPAPSPTTAGHQTVDVARPVPFTITVPGEWEEDTTIASATTFNFTSGVDRWVAFTELGPDTVEGWVEELTADDRFTVTTPEPIEVGGAPGVVLDLQVAEGQEEVVLFEEGTWGAWTVAPDRPNRIWVVQAPAGTVMIVTDAPAGAFDSWVEVVDAAISSVEWRE